MKKRQGFVSNSSSSSFVVIGYGFEEDFFEDSDVALEDIYDNFKVLQNGDADIPEGLIVVGFNMFEIDSETSMIDNAQYKLQDVVDKIVDIKKKLLDLDIEEEDLPEPEIYAGVKMS